MPYVKTALLSAFKKQDLENYASKLLELGVKIWASGGTAKYLSEKGLEVNSIEKLTGFDQLLNGRVKTLHPAVFAGILARDTEQDEKSLKEAGYPKFDLVYVNLYPFIENAFEIEDETELVELIDIGGIALLRAAAKNFRRTVVATDYDDLKQIIETLERENYIPEEMSRNLAVKTFFMTSYYDSIIAKRFWDGIHFPKYMSLAGTNENMPELRYGENPHQHAALYMTHPAEGIPKAEVLWGKPLSFNNFVDLDSALTAVLDFKEPACVIVKHNSPCGIAVGKKLIDAYEAALASDPLSAFGGIVALNRKVDEETAELMSKHFFECIVAPEYDEQALETLKKRKNLRILRLPEFVRKWRYNAKIIAGGVLVQNDDPEEELIGDWQVVTDTKPTEAQREDLIFAMKAAKFVKSNSVVIAKNGATVGIGGGLPSRVDAAILAVRKAGDRANGAVAASDAFLPFPDTLYVLAQAGVKALIQPGGSRNDKLSIEAANKLGVAMVFTGRRHFRH